jgi:hypothetical protein
VPILVAPDSAISLVITPAVTFSQLVGHPPRLATGSLQAKHNIPSFFGKDPVAMAV